MWTLFAPSPCGHAVPAQTIDAASQKCFAVTLRFLKTPGGACAQASGCEGGAVEMTALGAERTSPSFTSAEGSVAEEEGSARPSSFHAEWGHTICAHRPRSIQMPAPSSKPVAKLAFQTA